MAKKPSSPMLSDLFPPELRDLLTATGRHFIERIGPDLVRQSTLQVLLGHNVRTQTEPLTRQRIAEISGALIAMFERGRRQDPAFYSRLSALAVNQLGAGGGRGRDRAWPAQWALGLTSKGVQNVLRNDVAAIEAFVTTLDSAIAQAGLSLESKLGPLSISLSLGAKQCTDPPRLGWSEVLRLTTAIGCAELAVRGSDKSRYGKLFERLVLGSVLTILGFRLGKRVGSTGTVLEFWLSDSSDDRECDATAIIRPGSIARFDIGFIGKGNPEIVRDKLSRFARDVEKQGRSTTSTTFVVIDRYPTGPKANSLRIAAQSGTPIIQMSMSLWPRELAREMREAVGYKHPLAEYNDTRARDYITKSMSKVDVMAFLQGADDSEEADSDVSE